MTESDRRDVQLHGLLSNSRRHAIAHQFDEAIAEIERARAIDPIAPTMHTFAAMMYAFAGRHDVGFTAVRHALTLDPDHFPAHAVRGHLYDRTGEPDAALAPYRSAHQLSGGIGALLGFQSWVLGRTGRDDDARRSSTRHSAIAIAHSKHWIARLSANRSVSRYS